MHAEIARHVEPGSKVYTDEHGSYTGLRGYQHHHVNHSAGEYVGANDIHINAAESMWAMLNARPLGCVAQGHPEAPAPLRERSHLPAERRELQDPHAGPPRGIHRQGVPAPSHLPEANRMTDSDKVIDGMVHERREMKRRIAAWKRGLTASRQDSRMRSGQSRRRRVEPKSPPAPGRHFLKRRASTRKSTNGRMRGSALLPSTGGWMPADGHRV